VLRSDWLTTGPKVGEFEEAFAAGWARNTQSPSVRAPLPCTEQRSPAGLKPGDERSLHDELCRRPANCVLHQGGRVVFADVCSDTLTSIRSGSRAHPPQDARGFSRGLRGHPQILDSMVALAERHGLRLSEDACHALGADTRGRRTGAICAHVDLQFPSGEASGDRRGGMVDDGPAADLAEALRKFPESWGSRAMLRQRQNFGPVALTRWFCWGFNYRLTDSACALGLSQLKKLGRTWPGGARLRHVTRRRSERSRG